MLILHLLPIRPRRLCACATIVAAVVAAQIAVHPVTRVIDGDTIEIEVAGQGERVRYIGIDTPESVHPRREVQPYALAADAANRRLVEGKRVRIELDVQERDRYGRLLAYVWADTLLVNEWLVRHGFAVVSTYPPNVRYVDRFVEAQREAREEGRGLWSRTEPEDSTAVRARAARPLGLRREPSETAERLETVPTDGVVAVQRCRGRWCRVRGSGAWGWVPKRHLIEVIEAGG